MQNKKVAEQLQAWALLAVGIIVVVAPLMSEAVQWAGAARVVA